MKSESTVSRTLDLPSGALMPFQSVPGERVRILYGRIWLTEEGNLRDAFLASGEEVSLATRGRAVIEALGPARVQVTAPIGARMTDAIRRDLIRAINRLLGGWSRRATNLRSN